MLARVSNIETFRQWREDEEQTPQDLVERLTAFEPSEAMLAGTAFHKALEDAQPGAYDTLEALGYTFHLTGDGELALPAVRELRASKHYGPLRVSGQVDVIDGLRIEDHKTTSRFDPDRYLAGAQWKFYLDIFGADVFRWTVFEVRQVGPQEYEVKPPQLLEQHRYPGLHEDCAALAADYFDFATRYMPDHSPALEAA
jgi:hypothetical protein